MAMLDEETQARFDELRSREESGTLDDADRIELQHIRNRISMGDE
jgi:hypothetical protein